MSSPVAINRPASPSESLSSVASSVSSNGSASSRSSTNTLVYTRDELLALAVSPLSQVPLPPAVAAFPMILRKTRRGVLEAYQTLDYARSTSTSGAPSPASVPGGGSKPNARHLSRSNSPPHARQTLSAQMQPPMLKIDVYVPPARRIEQEQRARPGRDVRSSRMWKRPAAARSQTQSRW